MDNHHPDPAIVVIFGAGGDLTQRKLLPALYNLYTDKLLPPNFAVMGIDIKDFNDDSFRSHTRDGVDEFSRKGKAEDATWGEFAPRVTYFTGDFTKPDVYKELANRIEARAKEWGAAPNIIFYLATAPRMFSTIPEQLCAAGLTADKLRARVVIEKPFGRDLKSAIELNFTLNRVLKESQIYRIDHYLGKETVQNLLAFRFANSFVEPTWNRNYVDNVQITVAEEVGVEDRAGYYDQAGALRDMVQNHILGVLTLIAMEAPVSFAPDEIRNKKRDVLYAIREIKPEHVSNSAVRGQYGAGLVQGKPVTAYRASPGVNPESGTETFVGMKLHVDNWRWQGVPFYLRTGKCLPARVAEVSIEYRHAPHRLFPMNTEQDEQPNRLVIQIQPDEGILMRIQAKAPGATFHLWPVDMHFSYKEAFRKPTPEAYETLLLDVLRGDATQFMRADLVEASWDLVEPVLDYWANQPPGGIPLYAAGTWGPPQADMLLARDGRSWSLPVALELSDRGFSK